MKFPVITAPTYRKIDTIVCRLSDLTPSEIAPGEFSAKS
jgi:hypothetical protein